MDMDEYVVDVDSRYPDFSDMNNGEHLFYPGDKKASMGRRFSAESNRRLNNVEPESRYAPRMESPEQKLHTLPLRARSLIPNTAPYIGPVKVGNYADNGQNCGSGGLCCENMVGGLVPSQNMLFIIFIVFIFYSLIVLHGVNRQLGKIAKLLRSLQTA